MKTTVNSCYENFREELLKSQKKNQEIWMKEFEKNGNSTKSVWGIT